MKKVITITLIIIAAAVAWHYRFALQKFSNKLPDIAKSPVITQIEQEITTPPPLVSQDNHPNSTLSVQGVISWTNSNRRQNGNLPALKENAKLDAAANVKLKDMFSQQYFEHINPQGVGPGDLAKKAGYSFIAEGENLALGNFEDDRALLTAWMNSPGHRANILNIKYEEIGVAVGKGKFKGQDVWLAVQEFGKPSSSCPQVDPALKAQTEELNADAQILQAQLQTQKAQLDSENPQTQEQYDAYNQQVAQYNNLVHDYDNRVDVLKQVTGQYNAEVNAYNQCISK